MPLLNHSLWPRDVESLDKSQLFYIWRWVTWFSTWICGSISVMGASLIPTFMSVTWIGFCLGRPSYEGTSKVFMILRVKYTITDEPIEILFFCAAIKILSPSQQVGLWTRVFDCSLSFELVWKRAQRQRVGNRWVVMITKVMMGDERWWKCGWWGRRRSKWSLIDQVSQLDKLCSLVNFLHLSRSQPTHQKVSQKHLKNLKQKSS